KTMEVTYKRSLHKSYMCIKEQETVQEEYELGMLEHQKIPGLLPMQITVSEGERNYLYDISGKQQIGDYLSGEKVDEGMLRKLLFSIQELCGSLWEYLLREDGVCLESEFIYVNLEDGSLYFTYLPFQKKSLSEAFERCMEQVLRKIDHQDKAATELGYQVYQMCIRENINIQTILETALGKKVQQDKEREDTAVRAEIGRSIPGEFREAKENIWETYKSSVFSVQILSKISAVLRKKKEKDVHQTEKSKQEKNSKELNRKEENSNNDTRKGETPVFLPVSERDLESAEKEEAPIYPTVILGIQSQEPIGKLVYQGVHGCGDILVEGDEFLLGKNHKQADGVIEAEGVSRLHARISRQGGIYYIEDLNSTNGTYLNDEPLEYHQKRELCRNDHIRFGMEEYMFS
ncbi:MAG: FHA domain-containing protein, partial [Eubacterium sp.]|nr:FHA domain-containing protein [Eubacterium sp.]